MRIHRAYFDCGPACLSSRFASMNTVANRVGIDLVSVDAVRQSIAEHGQHYLERVYTERELADCAGVDGAHGVDPERLAARFAAKEAALKVLRPGEVGLTLRAIEVRRAADGWVDLQLSGAAAALARRSGLSDFALSITHEAGFASAVVIAQLGVEKPRTQSDD
jgi:holo-[acyl-carrier protein] synthase